MKHTRWLIYILVLSLAACEPSEDQAMEHSTSAVKPDKSKPVRQIMDALTQDQARLRKSRVSQIHYTLYFDLASSEQVFSGRSKLRFDLTTADTALTVDLSGAEIDRIVVNGKPQYLQVDRTVNWIRTLLFAGLRSAVLWRQLGGGRFSLMFGRKKMLEQAQTLLPG